MLDQKIGGNVNVNLSNNFNENLKLKGVFSDSVISGNALGGKITDDLALSGGADVVNTLSRPPL